MAFDLLSSRLLLEQPQRLTEIDAWHEHIPLAFFLVELQQPSLIVELGTWRGDSYCAFCQAVAELLLPTQCYAVDLWKGDEHTGPYPEQHYEELKAYHDARYGAFSRLVRSSFDDSLEHFADGSIDLLHVDGCHRYETAKHDFEAWQAKLSDRAVVLLHDTNVREGDFGVWRLWDELSSNYPSFAFAHSHGLGVLAVGSRPDPPVLKFLALASRREQEIRRLFFTLGSRAALRGRAGRLATELESANAEAARAWREALQAGEEAARARQEALQAGEEAATAHQEALQAGEEAARAGEEAATAALAIEDVKREREALRNQVEQRDMLISAIYNSRSWRVTAPLRAAKRPLGPIVRRLHRRAPASDASETEDQPVFHPDNASPRSSEPEPGLLISVLMPVHDPPRGLLGRAIASVKAQTYPGWELCICDDGSTTKDVAAVLRKEGRRDERVTIVRSDTNEGISSATNRALDLARGDYVALLDHDDELAPDALLECATFLDAHRETDVLYTDEDKIDLKGQVSEPFFKPGWSPELFRGVMYVGHLLVARRSLVQSVGGFDPDFDGVQDYELMLRLSEHAERIEHLPTTLYHWRKVPGSVAANIDAKPNVPERQVDAVNAHLRRCGVQAIARRHPRIPHRVELHPERRDAWPSVSIAIASADGVGLDRCLGSIFRTTSYPSFDVVVAASSEVTESFDSDALKVVPLEGASSPVRAINSAIACTSGEVVIVVDALAEVVTSEWIQALVWPLELSGVGAVGPLLVQPDLTVLSAGLVLGKEGSIHDPLRGLPQDADGRAGSLCCIHEVAAVRSTCIALARQTLIESGRFREDYRSLYYDVDLCFRLRRAGKRVLFTPQAVLIHHETASRADDSFDHALLVDVWTEVFEQGDPYYSPRLSHEAGRRAGTDLVAA